MYGAIIGDLAGSIYEYEQIKKVKTINISKIIEDNSFFSDDTILTISLIDAILNNKNYEQCLKEYGLKYSNYKPNFSPYFDKSFSAGFINWINGTNNKPSIGNGALMRISPVGYLFNTEEEVIENSLLATIPSHNTKEAIDCSAIIALIIYWARNGYNKEQILNLIKDKIRVEYTPFQKFNVTCYETLPNCLYALFSSNEFEESIRKVISYGGDTDTNACIVGSMAEAMFGINENLIEQAKEKIPKEFNLILERAYKKII